MANDPAFLFYPGDYLRDTQCLSEPAQVAYDRIMCEHMRNICISQAQLDFFTKRLTVDQKSEVVMVLTKVEAGYQIKWVAESIAKRRDYSESRRQNRSKYKNISSSYDPHMENENEIVNEIKDSIEKELNKNAPRGMVDDGVVVQLTSDALDLIDGVCAYFDVRPVTASIIYNTICEYATTLLHRNELQIASTALKNYIAYKTQSGEQRHNVTSWIGTMGKHFRDGQWVMMDWDSKLKKLQQHDRTNGKGSPAPAGSGVITGGKAFGNIRGN